MKRKKSKEVIVGIAAISIFIVGCWHFLPRNIFLVLVGVSIALIVFHVIYAFTFKNLLTERTVVILAITSFVIPITVITGVILPFVLLPSSISHWGLGVYIWSPLPLIIGILFSSMALARQIWSRTMTIAGIALFANILLLVYRLLFGWGFS